MSIKTRYTEFKDKNGLDNVDVAVFTITGLAITAFIGIAAYAIREEFRILGLENEFITNAYSAGKTPLRLENGSLISVDDYTVFTG